MDDRCPRCAGPFFRDDDEPACLSCGHRPLSDADRVRLAAVLADDAESGREPDKSRLSSPRPRRTPDADRLLALAAAPEGITRPDAHRALGRNVTTQLETMAADGRLVREESRHPTGARVWVYRPALASERQSSSTSIFASSSGEAVGL